MPGVKIGVLISGSGTNLQSIIDNIQNANIDANISIVISSNKDAYGLTRAKEYNIKTTAINEKDYSRFELYNDAIIEELKNNQVELVVLAGYIKMLSKEFIENYRNKIINIHPSLIPSFCGKGYYGLKVHQAAIDYGVKLSGATVHFVDEEADHGPIIMQKCVSVDSYDTPQTLQQKVLKIEHEILPLAIQLYCEGRISIDGRKVIID